MQSLKRTEYLSQSTFRQSKLGFILFAWQWSHLFFFSIKVTEKVKTMHVFSLKGILLVGKWEKADWRMEYKVLCNLSTQIRQDISGQAILRVMEMNKWSHMK